jgi:hypothetical protein
LWPAVELDSSRWNFVRHRFCCLRGSRRGVVVRCSQSERDGNFYTDQRDIKSSNTRSAAGKVEIHAKSYGFMVLRWVRVFQIAAVQMRSFGKQGWDQGKRAPGSHVSHRRLEKGCVNLALYVGSASQPAQGKEQERPRDPQRTRVPQFAQFEFGSAVEPLLAGGFPCSFAGLLRSHSRICTEPMFLFKTLLALCAS